MNKQTPASPSDLRATGDAYEDAITRESEHWGARLPAREASALAKEDASAARELRINRATPAFRLLAKKRDWHFERALSLGCGEGRAERELLNSGVCGAVTGIDVSEDAIAVARRKAADENLPISYLVGDLNRMTFEAGAFDLIYVQNCLHHIVELEHIAAQMASALKPGGLLWVQDFIGESQFQWSDRRIEIVNRLRGAIPEEILQDRLRQQPLGMLKRKDPSTLPSPFEAIRSAEIVPVLERFFEIEERWEGSALMPFLCPRGTRTAYLAHPAGPALIDLLFAMDQQLQSSKVLPPTAGRYLMRARATPLPAAAPAGEEPERTIDRVTHIKFPVPERYRRGHLRADEGASVQTARINLEYIRECSGLPGYEGVSILDFGCGVKFTQGLIQDAIPFAHYTGMDVFKPMISWLQKHVKDPRFRYELVPFHNAMYNKLGEPMHPDSALPCGDRQFDLITLQSVFTHFAPEDFQTLLIILRRYCKPDGRMFFTCFTDNEQAEPFVDAVPGHPLLQAMYHESFVRDMIAKAGWSVQFFSPTRPDCWVADHFVCVPGAR